MTTPNVLQNIKCKMSDSSKDSYYDSWALIDTGGTPCMTWAWNPFYKMEDREAWENEDPVEVNSAFGGCPLIKTTVLNYINWATRGGCEHWHFCEMARQDGSIIVIPEIKVKVHIEETAFPNEKAVVKRQETLLKLFSKF